MAERDIKKINTNTPEMDYLLQIYGMGNATLVINKATELNIFELLYSEKEPISADEFGIKHQFKPEALARLLNCLTALKLVTKEHKDGRVLYSHTNAGDLLATSNPHTLKIMQTWSKWLGDEVETVLDKIKITDVDSEKREEKEHEHSRAEEEEANFDWYQGMHNFLAPQAKALVTHHNLKDYKTCFDLGGGSGVISFELKRQYPEMDVTVIEMKNAVKLAKEKFVPGNEHLGVKFVAGDFFKTPFSSVDLFVVSAVLRGMNQQERDNLISICFKALNPGGAMLVLEHMQNEDKDGGIYATIWDLSYVAWNAGLMTPSEFKTLFAKHGFGEVTCTFTQEWNECDIIFAEKT